MSPFVFFAFLILGYLLFRLVFGFILPIVRTTRQVKRNFRQMQERMNGQYQQQGAYASGSYGQQQQASSGSTTKGADDDYIEFEEVK